jgi:hypothetical protein
MGLAARIVQCGITLSQCLIEMPEACEQPG